MITKRDIDRCKTLAEAQQCAYDWFGTLVTYRDALDLCSAQLIQELKHDGATLDDPMVLHPEWLQLRQQIAINVFHGWERRKRQEILHIALYHAQQEVSQQLDAAGIEHAGHRNSGQLLANYVIAHSPSGNMIFDFLSNL